MTGDEVLAAWRRDLKLADIRLVFLNGQTQLRQVRHSMNLGAEDYPTKQCPGCESSARFLSARLRRRRGERGQAETDHPR
jgi:DNA-binding response OmpR family regulator